METEPDLKQHLLTQFEEALPDEATTEKINALLAYSGGLDSHVLLHALSQIREKFPTRFALRAIHINHGLQNNAARWAEHCEQVCNNLNVSLTIINLSLTIPPGESLEAAARNARYHAFTKTLAKNEYLLTAHHQNDQAETILIQLFRGAGVQGMAAMPILKPFAKGHLFRPLLGLTRAELANYAQKYQLQYIDDPSNTDTRFDRNFIRHTILPTLSNRWPGIITTLSRASYLQAENQQLIEEYLHTDYTGLVNPKNNALELSTLKTFSLPRQKALIRYWLKQQTYLMPSAAKLEQILHTVIPAKPDAAPCVCWDGVEVRRFQEHLYAIPPRIEQLFSNTYTWYGEADFVVPETRQTIKADSLGKWLSLLQGADKPFTIRFRQEGERVKLPRHAQTHSLKKLMQSLGIPPWERAVTPLIFLGNQLICIYGYRTY